MIWVCTNPDGDKMTIECTDGAVAFNARALAAGVFDCEPHQVECQADETAKPFYALRFQGNASGANTLRLEIRERRNGRWTKWRRM